MSSTRYLVIRAPQLRALARPMNERFAHMLAGHARRFFPQDCLRLGEAGVLDLCRHAIDRAAHHAIVAENDICKLLNLMFVFGRRFDVDPRLPWAAAQLAAPGVGPVLRINRLYATAQRHTSEATGLFASGGEGES